MKEYNGEYVSNVFLQPDMQTENHILQARS